MIEYLNLPPIPILPSDIGDEWKQKRPTHKQLKYIKKMLPDRKPPTTRGEAAIIIDVLISKAEQEDKYDFFDAAMEPYDMWWDEGWLEDEFEDYSVPF